MTLLHWDPSYSLGIPSVDMEHRQMINEINRVHAGLERQAHPFEIESALEDIYAGIASHFALEERYMREAGYPEYAAHKNEHEDLLDQIRDLMDQYHLDPEQGRKSLEKSLSDWFSKHFATFDARLHHSLGDHH